MNCILSQIQLTVFIFQYRDQLAWLVLYNTKKNFEIHILWKLIRKDSYLRIYIKKTCYFQKKNRLCAQGDIIKETNV